MISGLAGWFSEWAGQLFYDGHLTCLVVGSVSARALRWFGHMSLIIQQASPGSFVQWWFKDSQEEQKREKFQCTLFRFLLQMSHFLHVICQNKPLGEPRASAGRDTDIERGITTAIFANSFPREHDRWKRNPWISEHLLCVWQCAKQFGEIYGGKESVQSHIY